MHIPRRAGVMNINKLVCVAFDSRGVIMTRRHAGMSPGSPRGPVLLPLQSVPHCAPNVQPQATQLFPGLPLMAYFLTSMAVVQRREENPGTDVAVAVSRFTAFSLGARRL